MAKVIVRAEPVVVADTLHYTVPAGFTATVVGCTMSNYDSSNQTYSFYTPATAATAASTANVRIPTKGVSAGQVDFMLPILGQAYEAGAGLRTICSDATSFNMHLTLEVVSTS